MEVGLKFVIYPSNHQLRLVVCDSGIGVPNSMRKMHEDLSSDQDALLKAIEGSNISKSEYKRGNGLAGAIAIAQRNEGSFVITSGKEAY